jgi:hypothetical protein
MDTMPEQDAATPATSPQYINVKVEETPYTDLTRDPYAYEEIKEPYAELNPATLMPTD